MFTTIYGKWHLQGRAKAATFVVSTILVVSLLCTDAHARKDKASKKGKGKDTPAQTSPAENAAESAPASVGAPGAVDVDISNLAGVSLPGRVRLEPLDERPPVIIEAANGKGEGQAPAGKYRAYAFVLQDGVPILVDVQDIDISPAKTAYVLVTLLEGSSGKLGVRAFDYDGDLAIDSVELKAGTNREDAGSVPGRPQLPADNRVLANEMRWYRGELAAHSSYGGGSESVEKLIARAEKEGLDFLAITDRNTMQSIYDSGYKSDKLVLIPAMEWGNDQNGYAYIYGPKTAPDPPTTRDVAQAECIRVQAQGGVFAIAHPCLPSSPWLWGLSYVNAINVWYQEWKSSPPLRLSQLSEDYKTRDKGRLVHSIAAAAARADISADDETSANEQGTLFWDYEMTRGLMACAIGASGSTGPKQALGRPITYVKARSKSLPGILEGLRLGYTYVSKGLDGPQLFFQGDVLPDKNNPNQSNVDVSVGGIVPVGVETIFNAGVKGANGGKLQVIQDGRVLISKSIEGDTFVTRFPLTPNSSSAFRVRVLAAQGSGGGKGKGKKSTASLQSPEVLALSSPIYAQDITRELLERAPNIDPDKLWVRVTDPNKNVVGPESVDLDGTVAPQQKPGAQ